MNTLLLEPHQDDAVIFAAFTCMRYQPRVITLLKSQVQEDRRTGITNAMRESENAAAMQELGITQHEQWPENDRHPDWGTIEARLEPMADEYEMVFAPAVEEGGHEDHSAVGEIALAVFGDRVHPYLTYRRGLGRTRGANIVPWEPEWVSYKLRALACFHSQIAEPSTRDWFMGPLYEYAPE